MAESPREELRLIAERAANEVRNALIYHADVMSRPAVLFSEVADADDRVVKALNAYREPAERLTGLSVLLSVPTTTDDAPAKHIENSIEDEEGEHRPPAESVILEAHWYFDVTDPRLIVAEARRRVGDILGPEREEVDASDLQLALAALFDHDVPWPPPEYSKIGLIVTGLDVAVHEQESRE